MIYINKMHHLKVANIWKNVLLKIKPLQFTLDLMPAHNPCVPSTKPIFFLAVRKNRAPTCLACESVHSINRQVASLHDFPPHSSTTAIEKNFEYLWALGHKRVSVQEFISANRVQVCISIFLQFVLCC